MQALRRMVGRRDAPSGDGPADGPAGADVFSAALARAGQGIAGLDADVADASQRMATGAELAAMLPDHALIAALAQGDAPAGGAMVLSPPVLAALVEVLTTGALGRHPVEPRRPTRTDAAMVADFVDAVLAPLSGDAPWRFTAQLPDRRPLAVMLGDAPLVLWQADLRLGGGRREGTVWLALPPAPDSPAGGGAEAPPEAFDLAARLDGAEVRMDAVLARPALPLSQLMALQAGDTLPLQGATLDSVRLTGVDSRLIGEGRLGQVRGMRALRLTQAAIGAETQLRAAAG